MSDRPSAAAHERGECATRAASALRATAPKAEPPSERNPALARRSLGEVGSKRVGGAGGAKPPDQR
jgi:hypothetical protein